MSRALTRRAVEAQTVRVRVGVGVGVRVGVRSRVRVSGERGVVVEGAGALDLQVIVVRAKVRLPDLRLAEGLGAA